MQEINQKPQIHVFICTNTREHLKPCCGPTLSRDHVKEVKSWIAQNGLMHNIHATEVQCLGHCNKEGGVIAIFPSGRYIKGIETTNEIKEVIKWQQEQESLKAI